MSLSNVKAMMFDIDGTLINRQCQISDKTYEALKILSKKGYKLAVNTGRPGFAAQKVLNRSKDVSDIFDYYYSCNGAEVIDIKNNKTTFYGEVKPEIIRELSPWFYDNDMAMAFYDKDNKYLMYNHFIDNMDLVNDWAHVRMVEPKEFDFSKATEGKPKCIVLFKPECVDKVYETIKKIDSKDVDILRSGDHVMEIIVKGVSKATAVDHYGNIIGVDNKDILCFGDAESDVPALVNGLGCMLGNKDLYEKYHIDYLTGSVYEEGIYTFLKDKGFLD